MDTRFGGLCLIIGSLALSLTACDTADDSYYDEIDNELEFRTDDDGGVVQPPGGWYLNGLVDPNVSGIDPAHGLDTEAGMSTAVGLLDDPDRWATAGYLVECALPAGSSITKVVDGETVIFNGLIGLAPEWEDDSCDQDCQEWVSACLLARTNYSGEAVSIWLQAEHAAIGYGTVSGAVREATFYGNLFEDSDGRYLCKGSGLALVEAFRDGRTCSFGSGGDCEFTRYADCTSQSRCTLDGPSQDVPANCKTGTMADSNPFHAISTYIVP